METRGKQGVRKSAVASKLCLRCNRVLPLSEFYPNKEWRAQAYRDVWCKECAAKYCVDEKSQEEYCFDNNRKWEPSFYQSALKKAQYKLSTDADFINPKTSQKKREEIEGRTACRQFFSMMNMKGFYGFIENQPDVGVTSPPEEKKVSREMIPEEDEDDGKLIYSRKWRGYFTQEQIDAQEETYAQYEEDFVLDNVNIRDYAKKVAKASLNADIAEDRMRRGMIPPGDYKEAQKIFDDLSKSSNFAACKRRPGETSGLGSLGEIIVRVEGTGKLDTEGFTWPEDSVDQAIKEYQHTLVAAGLQGIL